MKIEDLRIGNYYHFNGKIIKLDQSYFTAEMFYFIKHKQIRFTRITLNDKWFYRFGFKLYDLNHDYIFFYKENSNHLYRHEFEVFKNRFGRKYAFFINVNFGYVDELQNMYYDINKKRLTCKL